MGVDIYVYDNWIEGKTFDETLSNIDYIVTDFRNWE